MDKEEKITVEELVELKTELEKEIKEYLHTKFHDFQQKTGVPVSNIHVSFYGLGRHFHLSSPWQKYSFIEVKEMDNSFLGIIENVTVELDIDRVGEI